MRLCLKVCEKAKESAKTSFRLKEGGLAREGLISNSVNTKLSYSYWKPPTWLSHSWARARCGGIIPSGIGQVYGA